MTLAEDLVSQDEGGTQGLGLINFLSCTQHTGHGRSTKHGRTIECGAIDVTMPRGLLS